MAELSWRDAIVKVLRSAKEPMHYTDIAETIADENLRSEIGATPAATVSAIICTSIQNDAEDSPFARVGRGFYSLRSAGANKTMPRGGALTEESESTGLINAFGMYWERSAVRWGGSSPKVLGQQQSNSKNVDFSNQRGVYLLHDRRDVVYVGRTTDQPLGNRLRQHTCDRLNGRWNRFSWFGVYRVAESGALKTDGLGTYNLEMLITTMEALLIEGLEPPQNRKRGDEFKAVEFLQVRDERADTIELMERLKQKL